MAHNVRTRVDLTDWTSGGAVTPAEFENLDQNAFSAINGDDGGVWAPVVPVVIGGAGLEVAGLFEATGDANIGTDSGDTLTVLSSFSFVNSGAIGSSASDALDINGVADFNAHVDFNGSVTFNDQADFGDSFADLFVFIGEVQFDYLVTFSDDVTFDDPAVFNDDVTLGNAAADAIHVVGTMTVDESADFLGLLTANEIASPLATFTDMSFTGAFVVAPGATMAMHEPMIFATNGRIPFRPIYLSDANQDVTVTTGNVIGAAISTGRVYTIDDTGAVNGDWFLFFNDTASAYPLDIANPGGSTNLVTDLKPVDATHPGIALVVRILGTWTVVFLVSGP